MYIYAFGSICRGEIDIYSDIDLLAITNDFNKYDPLVYSIYSPNKIKELWDKGNPFAWHLHLEATLIFSHNGSNFINDLATPQNYNNCVKDCLKFYEIFLEARDSLKNNKIECFDLSHIFLSVRNISSCFALGILKKAIFSRNSAYHLDNYSIPIPLSIYNILVRARILATRGNGPLLLGKEIELVNDNLDLIEKWMLQLISIVKEGITNE